MLEKMPKTKVKIKSQIGKRKFGKETVWKTDKELTPTNKKEKGKHPIGKKGKLYEQLTRSKKVMDQ